MCTDLLLLDGDPISPLRVLRGPLESRLSTIILYDDRSQSELKSRGGATYRSKFRKVVGLRDYAIDLHVRGSLLDRQPLESRSTIPEVSYTYGRPRRTELKKTRRARTPVGSP
jgi:hypothetical protein